MTNVTLRNSFSNQIDHKHAFYHKIPFKFKMRFQQVKLKQMRLKQRDNTKKDRRN